MRRNRWMLLAALALPLALVACGDDDDTSVSGGDDTTTTADSSETTSTDDDSGDEDGTEAAAGSDPSDPCTLLAADDLESALDVTVDEGEDVSDRFTIGDPSQFESHACQWQASTSGDGAVASSYSIELIVVVDEDAADLYTGQLDTAAMFDTEVSDLDLGDEAVSLVDDGAPEILARRGDVVVTLSTPSDEVAVDDLRPLVETVLTRVDEA